MKPLSQIFRGVLFLILAICALVMAFVLMMSTAIAVAVLYIVARIKGRPFGVRSYWAQRTAQAPPPHRPTRPRYQKDDVVDVKMREIP